MFKALCYFTDKQDGNRAYHKNDIYPRAGLKPSAERIAELLSDKNARRVPVIVEINDNKPVKAVKEDKAVEIPKDFMNPPETGIEEAEQPKKRGRKKKDA